MSELPESHKAQSAPHPPRGSESSQGRFRSLVARAFSRTEDFIYAALGVLLAAGAVFLLVTSVVTFGHDAFGGQATRALVDLLDRLLLALMIVELLYTVRVHFREHRLAPEPFLIIGLIATLRRVLIVTAQFSGLAEQAHFRESMIELGLLTAMVLVLVVSLRLLHERRMTDSVEKGTSI